MKQLLLLFLGCLLSTTMLVGQNSSPQSISLKYVEQQAKAWQLTAADYQDAVVSDQVNSKHNGVTHIYLQQTVGGVPIHNAISTVNLKDGAVFHAANNFISDAASRVVGGKAPSISAAEAVKQAAEQLGIASPEVVATKTQGSVSVFAPSNISNSDIPVKQMYQLTAEGKLRLTYDLSIDMVKNADYWSVRVDANSGKIIAKNNWTVYCSHGHAHGKHEGHDCHEVSQAPASNSMAAMMDGTYRVYALPAESPNHGPYVTVTNPADPTASPFGWHDTDGQPGPEFTITRGNNVHAYLDPNNNDASVGGEPDGGADLVFDFDHNLNFEPDASPDAAQTNLFYMNNMMHDIFFRFGFDEDAGNFQQRNYTNEGQPTDAVNAEAMDGSGTNNANFSTPPDGGNGRMQMFLWDNPSGIFAINSPLEIAGIVTPVGQASDFGQIINADTDVSGSIALAKDVSLDNPYQGCFDVTNADEVDGKIAMIDRGACDFSLKAFNVQQAGAIACVIANIPGVNGGTGEEVLNMTGGDEAGNVTIPVIFITHSAGNRIKDQIEKGNEVQVQIKQIEAQGASQFDASYDNGVIAHEYGHGISNRLTGGPSNTGCLTNGEQMGEGWSDFCTLVTSAQEGDTGPKRRGIGTFVDGQRTDGTGIRQFPYSTDMSINPHTFGDVAAVSGVHAIGSIWCAMLWDLYWALSDEYGFDPLLQDPNSGSFKAVQLVVDGMKLQPCSPGFVEGRDAILAADAANYGGENEELIWGVFARRGLGYSADGGSTDSSTDGEESFDLPPLLVEELKITKTMPSLVKPGESFDVTLDIVNHIPSTQTAVFVTEEIEDGLNYVDGSASIEPSIVGNVLRFEVGDLDYKEEMSITYQLTADAGKSSITTYIDDFESNNDWEQEDLEGNGIEWFDDDVGVDDSAGWGIDEENEETDAVLISPVVPVLGERPALRFWHKFDTSPSVNGGFVQISNNGGATYKTVSADRFIRNAYPRAIEYGLFAIPSLRGFSGSTNDEFIDSYIDLSDYKGQSIRVRYRFGTQDESTPADVNFPGWFIDDFEMMDLSTYSTTACIDNADGNGGNCAVGALVLDSNGSVSNEEVTFDYFDVAVYPNPADDYLSIQIASPQSETAQIALYTIDGQRVYTKMRQVGTSQVVETIATASMAPGMYIVEVKTDNKITTAKAVLH